MVAQKSVTNVSSIALDNNVPTVDIKKMNAHHLLRLQQRFAVYRKGIKLCGSIPMESFATLKHGKGFGGTLSCGSSLCMSCSKKLVNERAKIIGTALDKCQQGQFYFFTLTQPSLCSADLQVERLSNAFSKFKATFNKQMKRRGIQSSILRSYDLTFRRHHSNYGGSSIYPHIHIHGLIWVSDDSLGSEVSDYAFKVWSNVCSKQGLSVSTDAFYCEPLEGGEGSSGAISNYVSKAFNSVGMEIFSHSTKIKFKTDKWSLPEFLVYISATGDKSALNVYNETLLAFKGKRFVSIPKFFRSFINEEETEELETEEEKEVSNSTIFEELETEEEKEVEAPDILISRNVFAVVRYFGLDYGMLKVALRGTVEDFNGLRDIVDDLNFIALCEPSTSEWDGHLKVLSDYLSPWDARCAA